MIKIKDVVIPEKNKIRLLWFSNHVLYPTGYGKVTREVCSRLAKDPLFEVHVVGEGGLEKGDQKWNNCIMWGAGHNPDEFMKRTAEIAKSINADVIIFLEDTFTLGNLGFHLIHWPCSVGMYCPQDGNGIPDMGVDVLRNMDFIIPMSYFSKKVMEREEFQTEPVIWHGVDLVKFVPVSKEKQAELKLKYGFKPNDYIIYNYGRNSMRKNNTTMIQALAEFLKDKPENVKAFLHIMSPDIKEANVFSFINRYLKAELGIDYLGNRIIVNEKGSSAKEYLSDDEIAETIQMSDMIISGSIGEGFGLIMSEGMACAKPIVHCAYSTPKELLVDERNGIGLRGIIIPSKIDVVSSYNVEHGFVDYKDLAKGMNEVYYNKDLAEELGRNGRDFAERFLDWDELVWGKNGWIETIKRNV